MNTIKKSTQLISLVINKIENHLENSEKNKNDTKEYFDSLKANSVAT